LWTFGKLLVTFEQRQYLFAAQCIWWIAALVQLDPALQYFLNNCRFPSEKLIQYTIREEQEEIVNRDISSTPRDIQQRSIIQELEDSVINNYQADSLRRTWKGRINHLPQTRKQLKVEQKGLARLQNKGISNKG